jgi:hypothetical protein
MEQNKNKELLNSFIEYCEKNPNERFWQALRNWTEVPYIFIGNKYDGSNNVCGLTDTFFFEDKNK